MTPATKAAVRKQSVPGRLATPKSAPVVPGGVPVKARAPATPAELVAPRRKETPQPILGAAVASPVVRALVQNQAMAAAADKAGGPLSMPPAPPLAPLLPPAPPESPQVDARLPVLPLPQQATKYDPADQYATDRAIAAKPPASPVELIPGHQSFSPLQSPEDVRNALLDNALKADIKRLDERVSATPAKKPFPILPLALVGAALLGG